MCLSCHLHVVVEYGVGLAVLLQQPVRIGDAEVFEVEKAMRIVLAHKLDKPAEVMSPQDPRGAEGGILVNEDIIVLAANPSMGPALQALRG